MQVLLPDDELSAFQRAAEAEQMTLSEWVRSTLRDVVATRSSADPEARIAAIRKAAAFSFPAPDIDEMLAEIESGYLERR